MKFHRVIARLDIKGPNLVKGVHLEGLRVLGKPEIFAESYYQSGADELFFQDTVASLYQRNNLLNIVTRTAENTFIPLTVGGGLRNLSDIRNALRAGADKVAINTAGIHDPQLITDAARTYGSSTVVIAIEAIQHEDGQFYAYIENGRESTDIEVVSWAREVQERGAGEILLTSIDREGTGTGYDLNLIESVSKQVSIPVIAHGGAGNYQHMVDAVCKGGADAVASASMFHYGLIRQKGSHSHHDEEGNVDFLNLGTSYKNFGNDDIKTVKVNMLQAGISLRHYE